MRRTTLGPISSSQMNSRQSLGGGRQSMGPARVGRPGMALGPSKVINPRHSIQPSGNSRLSVQPTQRKSSVGATRRSSAFGGGGRTSDPRPLSDKSFINACIRSLIEYLSSHQYDYAISPKLLTRPTKKDFHNIVQFLVRRVDTNYVFGEKFEEEFITIYRSLRYPFAISKTALVAVGSPHTWPALLASVTWLIELLLYAEEAELHELEQRDFDGEGTERLFFDYLGKAYQTFLSGDDEQDAALEEELVQQFESRNSVIASELKSIQDTNEDLRREIEALKSAKSSIPELQARKRDYQSDLEKFKSLISQLENHKSGLIKKIKDRKLELAKKEDELATLKKEIRSLEYTIDNQELSAADVEHIRQEKARLLDQLTAVAGTKDEIQKTVWDTEMKIAQAVEELERVLFQYNSQATKMQLAPANAKYAFGKVIELQMNPRSGPGTKEALNLDFKVAVKPHLEQVKEHVLKQMYSAQDQSLELQAEVERQHEQCSEVQEEVKILENKLRRVEDIYKREKEALDKAINQKVEETEEMEMKIQELRDGKDLDQLLTQNTEELQQLKSSRHENKLRFTREKELLSSTITRILFTCTDEKGHIESQLRSLEVYCTLKKTAMAEECSKSFA